MDISENPYASPPADVELEMAELVENEPERIRREYLGHEASVQSIGTLYYLSCGVMGIGSIGLLSVGIADRDAMAVGLGVLYGMLAVLSFFVGRALRGLLPWVRWPVGILAGIGLLGVPFGTLINGVILYLVFCRKGRIVFSREYREVIRQTPNIRYRTSLLVKILAVIVVVFLVAAVLAFLLAG